MLDRRRFLTAALGAATFPMPALARAEPTVSTIAETRLIWERPHGNIETWGICPSLAKLPSGRLLAAWSHPSADSPFSELYLQTFTQGLKPVSAQYAVGDNGQPVDIAMNGGAGMIALGTPDAALQRFDAAGRPVGRRVSVERSEDLFYHPAAGSFGPDGVLVAWGVRIDSPPVRSGSRAAVFSLDGRRRSPWFWAAEPSSAEGAFCFPLGVLPTATGATVASWMTDDAGWTIYLTPVAMDGRSGKPIRIAEVASIHASGTLPGFAPYGQGIAGVWGEGGHWTGALFHPDGSVMRRFESAEAVPSTRSPLNMHVRPLVPLSDRRILSLYGGIIWDTRTGKVVGRPGPDLSLVVLSHVVPLGRDRFAIAATSNGLTDSFLRVYAVN